MTLDHALRLLAMLTDTVQAQSEQIDELTLALDSARQTIEDYAHE